MKRGEIWTVAGAKDYAGKPRPAVVLQDDRFDATKSITICVVTTDPAEAPLYRIPIALNERNSLIGPSKLMIDKITTVPKNKLGRRIGISMPKIYSASIKPFLFFWDWAANQEFSSAVNQYRHHRHLISARLANRKERSLWHSFADGGKYPPYEAAHQ